MRMKEQVRLGNIASITTGLVVSRKKSIDDKGYKYKMLSLKSFNEAGYIDTEYVDDFISNEEIPRHQLTQEGDIVIRLSYPNTAVYISEEYEGHIISSLFAVIRMGVQDVIPQFIQIYLNSEKAKRQLAGDTVGSAISVIKTSSFKELMIPLYPVQYQLDVISVNELITREKDILYNLIREKEIYYKAVMRKMLK